MSAEVALRNVDVNASVQLQQVGAGLFKSGLYPNTKNEHGAYAIVQYGYELGIGPMMALQNINLIQGRPAASGQLMLSLAMSRGVTIQVEDESAERCVILFKRGQMTYRSEFTAEDAHRAGLSGKDNWKKWPKEMLYWRAVAKGVRRIAPEAVMGLYTPDEVSSGDVVDVVHQSSRAAKASPVQTVDAEVIEETHIDLDMVREEIKNITTLTKLTAHWKKHEREYKAADNYQDVTALYAEMREMIEGVAEQEQAEVVNG